jgi:hypothetical protein
VAATAVIVIASNAVNQIRCLAHFHLIATNGRTGSEGKSGPKQRRAESR